MSQSYQVVDLARRLELEPPLLLLLWGDVLNAERELATATATVEETAILTLSHWLIRFSGLKLHEHVLPLLRRLRPEIKAWTSAACAGEKSSDYDLAQLTEPFEFTLFDYRFANWTGLDGRLYDIADLQFRVRDAAFDPITSVRLNLLALIRLLRQKGVKDDAHTGPITTLQTAPGERV